MKYRGCVSRQFDLTLLKTPIRPDRLEGDREVNEFAGRVATRTKTRRKRGQGMRKERKWEPSEGERKRKLQQEHAYLACTDYLPSVNSIATRRNALLLSLYSLLALSGSLALAKGRRRIEEFAD